MQKVKIPRTVDPMKNAQKRLTYQGIIQVGLLKRLSQSVESIKHDINVDVSFELDEQGLAVISGKVNAEVLLECQRCNENFTHIAEIEFTCTPQLRRTKEDEIPESYDLVDLNEYGELDLITLVEDELILSLPQVAMHDITQCRVQSDNLVFGKLPEELQEEKPNPFDVLKNLKR